MPPLSRRGPQQHVPVGIGVNPFRAFETEPDLRWLGSRMEHEIVFQPLRSIPIIDDIDPRIDIPVLQAAIRGQIGTPLFRTANHVVNTRIQGIERN